MGCQHSIRRKNILKECRKDSGIVLIQRLPFLPIFGKGDFLQQPVFVKDVAQAIVQCLEQPKTTGKSYNIAGKAALTYNEVVEIISQKLNRKIIKIYIPDRLVVKVLRGLEKIKIPFPIKAEHVKRLNENKDFDYGEAKSDFGYQPIPFQDGIQSEIDRLTKKQ